jgi:hypothetical protein
MYSDGTGIKHEGTMSVSGFKASQHWQAVGCIADQRPNSLPRHPLRL